MRQQVPMSDSLGFPIQMKCVEKIQHLNGPPPAESTHTHTYMHTHARKYTHTHTYTHDTHIYSLTHTRRLTYILCKVFEKNPWMGQAFHHHPSPHNRHVNTGRSPPGSVVPKRMTEGPR
eukprot:GHVU01197017.1.p1 GENE.GHVU01197017.1~~GHVU01197017.1.p1  ORF type:complete len:136 (+),score=6.10 GHVU01197017.1:53-409(+)